MGQKLKRQPRRNGLVKGSVLANPQRLCADWLWGTQTTRLTLRFELRRLVWKQLLFAALFCDISSHSETLRVRVLSEQRVGWSLGATVQSGQSRRDLHDGSSCAGKKLTGEKKKKNPAGQSLCGDSARVKIQLRSASDGSESTASFHPRVQH